MSYMTDQDPLWTEPHWSTYWPNGTKVRSRFTGNHGEVVDVCEGRHLLIRWEASKSPVMDRESYVVRHSSDLGLERVR